MKSKKKALVATINYAGFKFEGLKLMTGEYAIAASQIARLFKFDQNQASRTIKRMIGKDFQFDQWKSTLNAKAVNVILLNDFGRLVNAIARTTEKAYINGKELAYAIQDASVTTTIEQAFDIAFNNKQKLENYQKALENRVAGKVNRRSLTDSIKDYKIINSHLPKDYLDNLYWATTNKIYRGLFGRDAAKLRKDWNCEKPRDVMTHSELFNLAMLEQVTASFIDNQKLNPFVAVNKAITALSLSVITR